MPMDAPAAAKEDTLQLCTIFHLLSDPTRLNILLLLLNAGERSVSRLCQDLQLPQPTVSHHLGLLRAKQLVGSRRQGKQMFYRVIPACPNASGRMEILIRLHHWAIHLSSLDASASASDNPGPCAT